LTERLSIPVLATERLRLRGPLEADFDAYAAFWAGPRTGFVGGTQDQRASWQRFAANLGHWAMKGFGWWIVTEDGRPVGTVGLHHPPYLTDTELGWVTFDGHEGHGVAFEAASVVLAWAARTLRPARLVSTIAPANTASVRLAQRLGAVIAGRAPHDPDAMTHVHDLQRYAA
jgi:RimJ/RimL family protein N-acetyltransferase